MKKIIKKSVMVTFENYYCKLQSQLVLDTVSEKRAIKTVKAFQGKRQCVIKCCKVLRNIKVDDLNYDLDYAISPKFYNL